MTAARFYSNAPSTTLPSGCTDSATSITVAAITGLPVTYPYTLILDPDTASEEVVSVTAGGGTTLTVTRGVDSTSGVAHGAGAVVIHGVSAREFRELQEHIAGTTGVHGLAGAPVGTTDTQSLSAKTLVIPTIVDFTSAQHDHGDADDGGNIPQSSVTSLVTALAAKASLTGAETLTNKTVSGPSGTFTDVTASATVTGADVVATDDLTVGDDAAVGGDLAVTGAATVTGVLTAEGFPVHALTRGLKTGTTNGSGVVTVTHGQSIAPTSVVVTPKSCAAGRAFYEVTAITATTFTVLCIERDGASTASVAVEFYWVAVA